MISARTKRRQTPEVMQGYSTSSGVVLCASFFTLLLGPSINYATGVIHVALLDEFQDDVTLTPWVGSIFISMFALMGPVASVVINIFDCRTCVVLAGITCMLGFSSSYFVTDIRVLFVTYALVGGLGTGLAQTGALVVLGYHFPENAAIPSGICITGAGLGMFVHPVLQQFLISTFGIHGSFLLSGGIMLNVSVCGMLMRPSKFEKERKGKILQNQSLCRKVVFSMFGDISSCVGVLTNISFIWFALSIFTFAMGVAIQYMFLPDFFVQNGATFQDASFALSVSGIGSIISRLLTGFASSDEKIGSLIIFPSLAGIIGIFTVFLPYMSNTPVLRTIYGFFLGLYTGGVWVLLSTITLDILGLEQFATGVGVVMFCCGVGSLTGPPVAGAIFQSSQHYYNVFLLSAALFFSTTVFGFMTTLKRSHQDNKGETTDNPKQSYIESKQCPEAELFLDKNLEKCVIENGISSITKEV